MNIGSLFYLEIICNFDPVKNNSYYILLKSQSYSTTLTDLGS